MNLLTDMSERYFVAVVLGVVSTAICGPMPQQKINGGQYERPDEQKHAIDHYTTGLVENPRIRNNYLNCFLDNGPCSPEAKNIKQMVPEAFERECAHCTELQKKVIEKMMCYLNNHQPEILKQVAAKFDPNGEYMKTYIHTIEQKGNEQFLKNPQQPQQVSQQPQQNPQQPQQVPQQPQQNPQQPQQNPQKSLQSQTNQQQSKSMVVSTEPKDTALTTQKS